MKSNSLSFKPQLIPTITSILVLILLLTLGFWQLHRLNWKNDLISEMNTQIELPAVDIEEVINSPEKFKYRKVKLNGEFIHDKEIHLFMGKRSARSREGYHILTPMRINDDNFVLVDRGWIDADRKEREERPETLLEGEVEVVAMIHRGEKPASFTPENDVEKNLWFWIDIEKIEDVTSFTLGNFYLRTIKIDSSPQYPIAGDAVIKQRNDHLQYAVTWFSLAIILIVIYFAYHKTESNKRKSE